MASIRLVDRISVSPTYLEGLREKFLPLEYLKPRLYKNACRYKNLRRIEDEKTKKIYHETPFQKIVDESSEDSYYTVTISEKDRLDIISNSFYGTPQYWWVIAQANYILDPFDIPVGITLRIPPITSLYNEGGILSAS